MKQFTNFDLTQYNSYRVHSVCKTAFFINDEEDIRYIYKNRPGIRKIILGNGNNIILAEKYYGDDFIIFSESFNKYSFTGNVLEAEPGITLFELSTLALEESLAGLEMFYDIPSSLGGAIVMNAGASGEEIKDLLVSARYYDPVNDVFADIEAANMDFTYRNSFFQRNPHLIIVKAVLKLKQHDKAAIKDKMETIKAARWAKQPKDYPNAGSVFKRPPGRFVGPMIDELNLKGASVGGAKVSERHGGFIVNYNNATGQDILDLIALVKEKVYAKFNVDLEIEQRIIL